jgi:hypothetical protein
VEVSDDDKIIDLDEAREACARREGGDEEGEKLRAERFAMVRDGTR